MAHAAQKKFGRYFALAMRGATLASPLAAAACGSNMPVMTPVTFEMPATNDDGSPVMKDGHQVMRQYTSNFFAQNNPGMGTTTMCTVDPSKSNGMMVVQSCYDKTGRALGLADKVVQGLNTAANIASGVGAVGQAAASLRAVSLEGKQLKDSERATSAAAQTPAATSTGATTVAVTVSSSGTSSASGTVATSPTTVGSGSEVTTIGPTRDSVVSVNQGGYADLTASP